MKLQRFLLIGALLVFLSALSPIVASAGTNGQQVAVYTGDPTCRLTEIVVKGINQRNEWSEWRYANSYGSQIEVTWNWWWKGVVDITYKYQKDGRTGSSSLLQDVPVNQPPEWYYKDIVYAQARCW